MDAQERSYRLVLFQNGGPAMKRFAVLLTLAAAMLLIAPISQGTPYAVRLSGANEIPANNSPATGFGVVDYSSSTHLLNINIQFSGLTGNSTMAHIHCCVQTPGTNAGVATTVPAFAGFPLGVTSGTYNGTLDMTQASSWNPAFITANGGTPASAEAVLAAAILNGNQAYLNVHTTTFPGGEIRSFLLPETDRNVPTLSEWALGALAVLLIAIGFVILRRRSA
jgi:hypothetical protein